MEFDILSPNQDYSGKRVDTRQILVNHLRKGVN